IRVVSEIVPCECTVKGKIETGVSAMMDDIIAALTLPLIAEEESPQSKRTEELPRIAFKGNMEEVNRFYYRRGWTDGLPIIPPTEEAVREMLTGTDLPPDHVVAMIIPRLGKATVEKIAVNAVMAGALPTYMPLLIAAVQTVMNLRTNFTTYEVSTGSWSPFWIINGPVRNDLNINSGTGALSPGNIANAAIGRAIGLIIKNIGGARAGIEDMGVLGNPGKYSMVVAENEEDSPWEPLHVEQGFNKEESTITVFFPNCSAQIWPYGTDDKGILRAAIRNVIPGRKGLLGFMMSPIHARTMAEYGWSKRGIAEFISEFARVPASHHSEYYGVSLVNYLRDKERVPLDPDDSLPIIRDPGWVRIIVAGGPGNVIGLFSGGWNQGGDWVTRKAELPAKWDGLVEKYKDLVPSHIHY
ncbi:hypothetical protein ACFLYL_04625, partial [Chloroflexota bacterium]